MAAAAAENRGVSREEFDALSTKMDTAFGALMDRLDRIGRSTREAELAANNPVHEPSEAWDEMSLLSNPAFKARTDMAQYWIRTTLNNEPEGANIARYFNMGWTPRKADTLPPGIRTMCVMNFEGDQVIGWRGTILCEMPTEMHRRLIAQRELIADNHMRGVEEGLNRDHVRGHGFGRPHFTERRRSVETGQRPAPVDTD